MSRYPLISLLLVIGLLFSGCSDYNIDDGVIRTENGSSVLDGRALITEDYLLAVSQGEIPGAFLVNKFGASQLDDSIHPITLS